MNNSERQQMNERFVAAAGLGGSSLNEIADGIVDPVKEMNSITGMDQHENSSHAHRQSGIKHHGHRGESTGVTPLFTLLFLLMVLLLIVLTEWCIAHLGSP